MNNPSPNYQSKLDMATELASLGARAVTITAVARTKSSDSRIAYKQIHGRQSQSGQTPTDHEWFLTNQTRRQHAAYLLITYAKYRAHLQQSPDAHGLAFIMAYKNYLALCKNNPAINLERLNLLITTGYGIGWKDITKGGSSKFGSGNVRVMKCRKCTIPHLVEAHYINYVCPTC